MNKKGLGGIIIVLALIAVALIAWYIVRDVGNSGDIVVAGDYTVAEGETLVLKDGASLKVGGNLEVHGQVECENGALYMESGGDMLIDGKLLCDRPEELGEDEVALGISIAYGGSLEMTDRADLETNGHVQVVDSADLLLLDQDEIDAALEDVDEDSGEGDRIGPFVRKEDMEEAEEEEVSVIKKRDFSLIKAALAAGREAKFSGKIWVKQPPKGVKQIVLFKSPNVTKITLVNFKIIGPDGRDGESDEGNSCSAKGKDGQDAMRFYAQAPNLEVNNFEILLGHGGNGGSAVTKKDCDPGKATGGEGGKSGNLKMLATNGIKITGDFIIHPGWAGNGGDATAYGKDGGDGEDGGDAVAIGGDAEDNEKAIRARGNITGQTSIKIGSMYGGNGGAATAIGGKGGNGPDCKSMDGGNGGKATVEPGDGGDAKIVLSGAGAGRTDPFEDVGGDAGIADAQPGRGGNGSNCKPDKPGGNGGLGGDAVIKKAKAGVGATRNGKEMRIDNQAGADAGNGGDGCLPGVGGIGGIGTPNGKNGTEGKNICPKEEEKKEEVTTGGGAVTGGGEEKPAEPKEKITVVPYGDDYIPFDQLKAWSAAECDCCDGDHYHARSGGAVTTVGGKVITDPFSDCGLGKVSEMPVTQIEVE